MKINEFIIESTKQRLDPKCWTGYKKQGTKMKGGTRVNNCVPANEAANPAQQAAIAINMKKRHQKPKSEGVAEGYDENYKFHMLAFLKDGSMKEFNIIANGDRNAKILAKKKLIEKGYDNIYRIDIQGMSPVRGPVNYAIDRNLRLEEEDMDEGENWSKHNHKRVGGMSDKSVKSYRRSHPGSKIQTAVTKKPSKIKKGSKDAKRRASFCARMRGMKKHRTSAKTARDPNSNINKSLRRWHCESIEQLEQLVILAEQKIRNLKK